MAHAECMFSTCALSVTQGLKCSGIPHNTSGKFLDCDLVLTVGGLDAALSFRKLRVLLCGWGLFWGPERGPNLENYPYAGSE